jgi:uncharacterized membrane protein HdeD (DUF308 family)
LSAGRRNKTGTLLIGLLLVGTGLALALAPERAGLTEWLIRLWPVFLICAGVVRVMGFAVERKPRSPWGGTLLIFVGILFLASRFHSELNVLRLYGRYWLVLLLVYASVELVRYYSHRQTEGPPPRLFTPWRLMIIAAMVTTGVLANRVATTNPSLLSALKLPGFLSGLRDSVVGQTFTFTDAAVIAPEFQPGSRLTVKNSYGDVRIKGGAPALRVTLKKEVRAWSEEDARRIADAIRVLVDRAPDGLIVTTNREQVDGQFSTHLEVEVPRPITLAIAASYGGIAASGISGPVEIKGSYGQTDITDIAGAADLTLAYSNLTAAGIRGNLSIRGAKHAKVSGVSGALTLVAGNGSVELRDITGPVEVDAPFCRITAQGLGERAAIKTEHASVKVVRASDLTIEAPYSDVRTEEISGDLQIVSSQSDVHVRAISGELTVSAEKSSVAVEEVQGPAVIETSHGSVTVKNFLDALRVHTSFRSVTLITTTPPTADVEVSNDHGEIKVVLPESSQFALDALSEGGQVKQIGFGPAQQARRGILVSQVGAAGPSLRLRTSFKSIIVQATGSRQAVTLKGD